MKELRRHGQLTGGIIICVEPSAWHECRLPPTHTELPAVQPDGELELESVSLGIENVVKSTPVNADNSLKMINALSATMMPIIAYVIVLRDCSVPLVLPPDSI